MHIFPPLGIQRQQSVVDIFLHSVHGYKSNYLKYLCYSLFHILAIKTSYRVDRVLFDFFFNFFEIFQLVLIVRI